jgi:putative transcriptional regulator
MSKDKTYKSDILAAIHETVSNLYAAGVIDEQTMRRFDESCLTQVHDLTAEEIIAPHEREQVNRERKME